MSKRLPDWPERLRAVVTRAHGQRFAWGVHDCCLWAADAVQAVTGVDHAAGLRGTYSDPATAQTALRRLGGLRGVASCAGARIRPSCALEGDVAIVRGCQPLLGVMLGGVWMVAATTGLRALPRDAAVMAWGVGRG